MKSHHLILFAALISLSTVALAQTDAQKSFTQLKTLAGTWQASITTDPPSRGNGTVSNVTIRVTSRGNAMVHEVQEVGKPDDPARYDHPLTMFYLEGDRLSLTHFCDAGNRPHMTAKMSPDGKNVQFDFVDIAGSTQRGYMHDALFAFIDADHHTEDWTYMLPGDKPMRAHFDLKRIQ